MNHRWRMRDRLRAYRDGELSAGQQERLERHLKRCPACTKALRHLEETETLLRVSRPEEGPLTAGTAEALFQRALATSVTVPSRPAARPGFSPARLALAGAGVLAVMTALWLMRGRLFLKPSLPPQVAQGERPGVTPDRKPDVGNKPGKQEKREHLVQTPKKPSLNAPSVGIYKRPARLTVADRPKPHPDTTNGNSGNRRKEAVLGYARVRVYRESPDGEVTWTQAVLTEQEGGATENRVTACAPEKNQNLTLAVLEARPVRP